MTRADSQFRLLYVPVCVCMGFPSHDQVPISACMPVRPSVCQPVHLSACLPVCPPDCLSVSLCVYLFQVCMHAFKHVCM